MCEELIALIKQVEAEQESQYVDEELGEWAEDMEVLEEGGVSIKRSFNGY